MIIIARLINAAGNAIASVRPSVRPFVSALYLRKRLTVDLELLHVGRS